MPSPIQDYPRLTPRRENCSAHVSLCSSSMSARAPYQPTVGSCSNELEQQGIVPKHYLDAQGNERARTPSQDISDALLRLRKLGQVPWWWLLDETRDVSTWRYSASVYEYVAESVKLARIDCWGGELPPLIICEARATRGVLERIAAEYLCPITATGGQSAGHIVN